MQRRSSPPVHLGPGEYFLMGDNHDNSYDAFGPVSLSQMNGEVVAVRPTGPRIARRD
jgi:type IV secretory pathway protease TraF